MSLEDKLTPHPILKLPTEQEIAELVKLKGKDVVIELLQLREDKIKAEKEDPYRHGYEPFHWKDADKLLEEYDELLILGGNRAGKTEYAAKRAVYTLVNKPNARVWCLHTTSQSSIQMQQNVIWKYLPPEFKTAKKNKVTNVQYSQKNGFSDGSFILPNGSQCFFMNYAQDRIVIEGGECDMIWCDELVPLDWVETLRYRTVTRKGKLMVTFTPILGYSQVVKEYVSGCKMQQTRFADLLDSAVIHVPGCPPGHMPYIGSSRKNTQAIIWFHSKFNSYSPFDQIKKALSGKTQYERKIRAYGYADNIAGSQFPRFSSNNIIAADKIPEEGTNYMAVDPAGARNWFMLWIRVDNNGNKYVYREWPDISMGEWALPDAKADGKVGPAQTSDAGRGIDDYKNLILELEDGENIAERYIDPRAGATQAVGKEGGTSLIELLDEEPNSMYFNPSAGIKVEQGIAIINDWLMHDITQPLSPINQPKLYISENCQNLIYSLREWTGKDKEAGATKDPIDALRYLAVMNPEYDGENSYKSVGGGSY